MRLIFLGFCLLMVSADALAYLDPATGSIILQGLIAGVAAFFAFVRNPIQTAKTFFAYFRKDAEETSVDTTNKD